MAHFCEYDSSVVISTTTSTITDQNFPFGYEAENGLGNVLNEQTNSK